MSDTTFIYALKEPDTGEIRYIGKSDDPQRRWEDHCGTKDKCHRGNWIRALKKGGLTPVLEIVDEIPYEFRDQLERAYITFFREQGCNLVNGTPGGDGVGSGEDNPNFGKVLSAETRKKISLSATGKKRSAETREKLAAARRGKKSSAETREKLSAAKSGEKNWSFGKCGEASPNFGKKHSAETRARMSVAAYKRYSHVL